MILTLEQHVQVQQQMARKGDVIWDKPELTDGLQACEDQFEINRASMRAAINAATAPTILGVEKKDLLIAYYIKQKAERDGAD